MAGEIAFLLARHADVTETTHLRPVDLLGAAGLYHQRGREDEMIAIQDLRRRKGVEDTLKAVVFGLKSVNS